MNSRERLMATLMGKETDRLAWAPLIDQYFTSSLPLQGYDFDEIDAIKFVGADVLLRHVNIAKRESKNVERRTIRRSNEEINIIETPVGSVRSVYSMSGNTKFKTEAFIKTPEDIKVMQYIEENTNWTQDYDRFFEIDKRIGDSGIASPSVPLTPIQELLQSEIGIEGFTYLLYDYPDELEEFMQVRHSKNLEAYRLMAQSPRDMQVFIAYEDTSTTVMSPAWYSMYCKDYINEYADIMNSSGKMYITHMCGKLSGMLDELKQGRMLGIDSVCPGPTGDLPAAEALSQLCDKIIIGGIDPPQLKAMSEDETAEYARKIIQDTAPYKNRFILSTGDATPFGTPIQNLITVSKIVCGNH